MGPSSSSRVTTDLLVSSSNAVFSQPLRSGSRDPNISGTKSPTLKVRGEGPRPGEAKSPTTIGQHRWGPQAETRWSTNDLVFWYCSLLDLRGLLCPAAFILKSQMDSVHRTRRLLKKAHFYLGPWVKDSTIQIFIWNVKQACTSCRVDTSPVAQRLLASTLCNHASMSRSGQWLYW